MTPGSIPAPSLQDAPEESVPTPTEQGVAVEGPEPTRSQVEEMDAGVLLFVLVLIVLMMIPLSFLLFRLGRRSGTTSGSRRGRSPEPLDPWVESARRTDAASPPEDDPRATTE